MPIAQGSAQVGANWGQSIAQEVLAEQAKEHAKDSSLKLRPARIAYTSGWLLSRLRSNLLPVEAGGLWMDFYIGQIALFACDSTPSEFLPCQGQILPILKYTTLYTVIGNQYGGNPGATFALPDVSAAPIIEGFHYAICVEGLFPSRS